MFPRDRIAESKKTIWQNIKSVLHDGEFSDFTTVRRHKADYAIVICMGLLMMIGLIVIYAIGPQRANVLNNAYGSNYSDTYFVIKQAISLGIALVAFIVMAFIPYNVLTKHASKLFIFALAACALLMVASMLNLSIAPKTLGATRWFNLGFLGSIQPSEFLKFSLLIFLAGFIGRRVRQGLVNDFKATLLPLGVITFISLLFVVVIQKDFGTGLSLAGIIATMLVVSGLNTKNGMRILLLGLAAGVILIAVAPHRVERIMTFLEGDSASTTDDSSYQIEHAKIAIGTGGLFGVGIGNSVQATGYLPEAINDSVFAIMGEVFGFVGLVLILMIFTTLLMRLLKLSDSLNDARLRAMAAGVFGWFGTHVILNIASMIGIFPLTGITLPLLSFGGTSMVFIAAALGVAFQLSHYTVHYQQVDLKEGSHEDLGSRRRVRRTRYTNRSSFTRN